MISPVVTLTQAIERLEKLKAQSTPGPWFVTYEKTRHPRVWGYPSDDGEDADAVAQTEGGVGNAHLIVALHRTIDAQLDAFHLARAFYGAGVTGPETATVFAESVLALARAVLGEETP